MNQQSKPYPYQPPFEDQVVFYNGSSQTYGCLGLQRKAKICPICNYPIHIRMISYPCHHFFCYQCYNKNTYACGYCSSLNSKIVRVDDNQKIYTCDIECSKAFQNQNQFTHHMELHKIIKQK